MTEVGARIDIDLEEVEKHFPFFYSVGQRSKYLKIERFKMFREISEWNGYEEIECRNCGQVVNLHNHHIGENNLVKSDNRCGGTKYHRRIREEIMNHKKLFLVLCKECHNAYHNGGSDLWYYRRIRYIEEEVKEYHEGENIYE